MAKLVIAWQSAAYGTNAARLSKELLRETTAAHVIQKEQKRLWSSDTDLSFEEAHDSEEVKALHHKDSK